MDKYSTSINERDNSWRRLQDLDRRGIVSILTTLQSATHTASAIDPKRNNITRMGCLSMVVVGLTVGFLTTWIAGIVAFLIAVATVSTAVQKMQSNWLSKEVRYSKSYEVFEALFNQGLAVISVHDGRCLTSSDGEWWRLLDLHFSEST
jgi:hypothetical protein